MHPPEQPRRRVLLEVADRRQRVVRAKLHLWRDRCDMGDGDLGRQHRGVRAGLQRGDRVSEQQVRGTDFDLTLRRALLHGTEAADCLTELLACLGVLDGHLVRVLGGGQRPSRLTEPRQNQRPIGLPGIDVPLSTTVAHCDLAPRRNGEARQGP